MASSNGSAGPIDFWRRSPSLTVWSGYGAALAAVGLALLFRYSLRDSFGVKVPYLQFYPAIIVAAWYGGLGPGVLGDRALRARGDVLLPAAGRVRRRRCRRPAVARLCSSAPVLVIAWLNHRLQLDAGSTTRRRGDGDCARRTARRDPQHDRRRHHRHRRQGHASRRSTAARRAAVRLSRVGGHRPQRQHADAVAAPRGARRLPGALSDDRRRQDHRHRPRSHRPPPRRHAVPAASVGRRDADRRRAQVHRHAARPDQARASSKDELRRQRSALARGHRFGRRRHHRDRRARSHRGVQSGGRTAVRLRGSRRCSAGTSTC